ncbi:MAG: hypothetical protein HOC93_06225 [Phycisphaerae bacterium]|nr:hypothetical protein [Phycisphaerae bacterium]
MNLKIVSLCFLLIGCGGPSITNPSATLRETGRPKAIHLQAMGMLDEQVGLDNSQYRETLHRMLWVSGYTNDARHAALNRLWNVDRDGVIKTVRQRLPRMDNWTWIEQLCEWIAEEEVLELDAALISSWSQPTMRYEEADRPERQALVLMYGEGELATLVFQSLLATNKSWQQGYRTRCWELLLRIGAQDKLLTLLSGSSIPEDDMFLLDLQRATLELGIMPQNKEEILWARELCKPEYSDFWNEAVEALSLLDDDRRVSLEMRDIPIAVTVSRHWPELATKSTSSLVRFLETELKNRKHYFEYEGGGNTSTLNELLPSHKNKLSWGDAVAIRVALEAMEVPEVRTHFFDYANRDHLDTSTEFGGVVELDKQGRFVIQEFEPIIRNHDRRFDAPQKMFDAAYTSLFHFHFHAQKYKNGNHAGPGMGDKKYADNTRANCLVLTYVNSNTMNVDYYRHGHVVVDLGTITLN